MTSSGLLRSMLGTEKIFCKFDLLEVSESEQSSEWLLTHKTSGAADRARGSNITYSERVEIPLSQCHMSIYLNSNFNLFHEPFFASENYY